MQTPKAQKGQVTGQGNAPVVYSTMAGHEYGEVPANAYAEKDNALTMQYATDRNAVGAFNAAAPALESTVVNGVAYEVFHDYYHNRVTPMRYGNDVFKSVGFRIAGQPDSFNFSSHAFFKRTCKAQKALQGWMDAMSDKYANNDTVIQTRFQRFQKEVE